VCSYLQIYISDASPSGKHVSSHLFIPCSPLQNEWPRALSSCPRERPRTVRRQAKGRARDSVVREPNASRSSSKRLLPVANPTIRTA
jgi:hypothetical protein